MVDPATLSAVQVPLREPVAPPEWAQGIIGAVAGLAELVRGQVQRLDVLEAAVAGAKILPTAPASVWLRCELCGEKYEAKERPAHGSPALCVECKKPGARVRRCKKCGKQGRFGEADPVCKDCASCPACGNKTSTQLCAPCCASGEYRVCDLCRGLAMPGSALCRSCGESDEEKKGRDFKEQTVLPGAEAPPATSYGGRLSSEAPVALAAAAKSGNIYVG